MAGIVGFGIVGFGGFVGFGGCVGCFDFGDSVGVVGFADRVAGLAVSSLACGRASFAFCSACFHFAVVPLPPLDQRRDYPSP